MPASRHFAAVATLATVFLAGLSCSDESITGPKEPVHANTGSLVALNTLVPSGAVEALIQQDPPTADGLITLVVRVYAKDVAINAYQGVVTFDPHAFQLVRVYPAAGFENEAHVLNTTQFSSGTVRFAACTPDAFIGADGPDGVEAFRFVVRPLRDIGTAELAAQLSVVGGADGNAVASDHVLSVPGLFDALGAPVR